MHLFLSKTDQGYALRPPGLLRLPHIPLLQKTLSLSDTSVSHPCCINSCFSQSLSSVISSLDGCKVLKPGASFRTLLLHVYHAAAESYIHKTHPSTASPPVCSLMNSPGETEWANRTGLHVKSCNPQWVIIERNLLLLSMVTRKLKYGKIVRT